jgi:hypothetical protein
MSDERHVVRNAVRRTDTSSARPSVARRCRVPLARPVYTTPRVGALVDRFSHQCHPIDIDADSWRNKESQTFHKKARAKELLQFKKSKA